MDDKYSQDVLFNLLVKFGQKEYLEQFQAGTLFCNTVRNFAEIEKEDVRRDLNEGVSNIIHMKNGTLELRPADSPNYPWQKFAFKTGNFTTYHNGNMFCMSQFIIPPKNGSASIELNPDFDRFGDHYLIVMNQPEFFERLKRAIEKSKKKVAYRRVEYTDLETLKGERSVFVKDKTHSWQNGFRIYFNTSLKKPLLFEMGDIRDISMIAALPKNRKFEYRIKGII